MLVRDPVVDVFFCVWFFLFGACIGSFLNVAVYRLPRGKSLAYPPSFCPCCGHFIRWFDNIPVFGWLKLGGKCRDCRSPISVRYPLIEAITGIFFGGIFLAAVFLLPEAGVTVLAALTLLTAGMMTVFFGAVLICFSKRSVL
ncbi:MAG: prepilin peptidase [Planctomycetaceae bacterium]|jgi:leader peptidase (prepilin peptidase)/N-methyltransferase|nr:prepilin peptidase [Planctomycetaceae bacterium]